MKVNKFHVTEILGATWGDVVKAVTTDELGLAPGFANLPRWREAVTALGENPDEVILMSTRPAFGARRACNEFERKEIEDPTGGAWEILTMWNVLWAEWVSGHSGSYITVDGSPAGWTIRLTVPIVDEKPYEGVYSGAVTKMLNEKTEAESHG